MTSTKSTINILLQRPSIMISVKVPQITKDLLGQVAISLNMNVSDYIRLAISERIEKDSKSITHDHD